jgi:hypothetical protein
MASNRRTHKFINSWAQLSIALEVILHAVLLVALIGLILFAPPFVEMFSQYSAEDHQAIARELVHLNAGKWPLFAFLAFFIGIVSILFSHHIVGPAYQLGRVLDRLKERDLDVAVKFRKWDYLSEVQDGFNQAVTCWREDIAAVGRQQREALSICREMKSGSASPRQLDEMETRLVEIEKVVQTYKTP